MQRRPLTERVLRRIHIAESGCWLWQLYRTPQGYGRIKVNGRVTHAHRVSWEAHNGPIPAGMYVCHRCDNPPCVNPTHLFLGTHADNMADAARKGRCVAHAPPPPQFGSRNGQAKLSDTDVSEIRQRASTGERYTLIATAYGVSRSLIYQVATHRMRSITDAA